MARVCVDVYPAKFSRNRFDGFYMDNRLKSQLDILLKNISNDWDFTIVITGSGEVRVGKSVLGMEIAAYWTDQIKKLYHKKVILNLKNFVFDGRKLIEQGNAIGEKYPNSALIYDEAGADLSGKKILTQMTQDVLDFYRECGQYNLLNILILPDYFDLPRSIAITRSIFLINVDYESNKEGIFERGIGKFYSRKAKKKLYLEGKKNLDYNAAPYDFNFRFYPFYPVNEQEYRQLKINALKNRERERSSKTYDQRDAAFYLLHYTFKLTHQDIADRITELTQRPFSHDVVAEGIQRFRKENKVYADEKRKLINTLPNITLPIQPTKRIKR